MRFMQVTRCESLARHDMDLFAQIHPLYSVRVRFGEYVSRHERRWCVRRVNVLTLVHFVKPLHAHSLSARDVPHGWISTTLHYVQNGFVESRRTVGDLIPNREDR